jgi:serine/threonine-protein kinase PpkA
MARVFLARDTTLDRKVAMKVMNKSLAADPSFRDRFLAEAKDTAKFEHSSIVSIHSMGVVDKNYYLVLEYLEEGTLKDHIRERQKKYQEEGEQPELLFSAQETLVLVADMADALSYAHKKNVVHRDLKPANILYRSDGKAVLSDFGIAKSVTENRELTQTGYSVGTPAYMSPEQKLGAADIDGRSDLYSLGIVFYEMLTGSKPYRTRTGNYADLRKELEADVPQLPEPVSYLQPLLERMLAKDPGDRYQTADDLLDDIRRYMENSGHAGDDATVMLGPVPGGAMPPGFGKPKNHRKTIVISAAAAALAAAVAIAAWQLAPKPTPDIQPVDVQTASQIESLKSVAQLHLDNGSLVHPPVSNAAEIYQRILEMQAGNPDAIAGMDSLLKQVVNDVEQHLESGDRDRARRLADSALHYFPESKKLADLREQAGP